jgi:hypothetical protein
VTLPNEARIALWASATQRGLRLYSDAFRAFYESDPKLPDNTEQIIGQLGIRCTLTSDTILFLAQHEKLWDAEMLSRSVLEGTAKLAFICLAPVDEREERVREFVKDIPDVRRLRRHRRVKEFLSGIDHSDDPRWRPLRDLCISEDEERLLTTRYPRTLQTALEQKWSIGRMLSELFGRNQSEHPGGLLYQYGFSSQLIHFDSDSVLVMWERERRSQERRRAVELAHAARLFSDILIFAMLRVNAAYVMKSINLGPLQMIGRELEPLTSEFAAAAADWAQGEYGPNVG